MKTDPQPNKIKANLEDAAYLIVPNSEKTSNDIFDGWLCPVLSDISQRGNTTNNPVKASLTAWLTKMNPSIT